MAPSILGYFRYGGTSTTKTVEKEAVRALPASWYTSQEMYELERRAIFSKKWLMTTHKTRLTKVGDWLKYNIAGFEFVICKDREENINAFHNICRHRAFPVVTGETGNAKIFSCKYHGWSYGLNGKLAKAPQYQDLPTFKKEQNGLLPIHTHIDRNGFVWVNLDSKDEPEIAWEDELSGSDEQARFADYDFEDYHFDHEWEQGGPYNWKILADNYNECYHCPTTHPDIPDVADLSSYDVQPKVGWIQHDASTTPEQKAKGMNVAATYYFPNASMNVMPSFFFIQRFVPAGPTSSIMRYEVYRRNNVTDEQFEVCNQMYKRIMSEDKFLCDLAQKNLNAGIFINGEMHPHMEKGPLFFQKLCRDAVQEHYKQEKLAKQEIWPARQNLPGANPNAQISKDDIDFCSGLACTPSAQEQIAW